MSFGVFRSLYCTCVSPACLIAKHGCNVVCMGSKVFCWKIKLWSERSDSFVRCWSINIEVSVPFLICWDSFRNLYLDLFPPFRGSWATKVWFFVVYIEVAHGPRHAQSIELQYRLPPPPKWPFFKMLLRNGVALIDCYCCSMNGQWLRCRISQFRASPEWQTRQTREVLKGKRNISRKIYDVLFWHRLNSPPKEEKIAQGPLSFGIGDL